MSSVPSHPHESLDEAAAFWFARLRSDRVTHSDRKRHIRWLNENAAHAQAYARYLAIWDDLPGVAVEPEIVEARREALALAPERPILSRYLLAGAAAALAVFVVASALLLRPGPSAGFDEVAESSGAELPRVLRTAVGERAKFTLVDGSVVELNTDSFVEMNYSAHLRGVRLIRGQAMFEVAQDRSRPFVVEAAGQRITALGTAFDVRVDGDEMRVTLVEGRVSVASIAADTSATSARVRTLRPGEQLIAAVDHSPVILAADVEQQVSWRTGRLIFSDEPLNQVVAELNRYSTRKIILADPSLAELRVSGAFRAGAVGSFVAAMDAAFPVVVENRASEVVLSWE